MGSPRLAVGFMVVLLTILAFEEISADEPIWNDIRKVLGKKEFVDLTNGNTVRTHFIKQTIDKVQTKKPTIDQLSSNEKAVFQYLWDLLRKKIMIYTKTTVSGEPETVTYVSTWQQFFDYVREQKPENAGSENKDSVADKAPMQGAPNSEKYQTFWDTVKEELGEKSTVKLNNGKIVGVDFLKKSLDDIIKNGKTFENLNSNEKAVLQFLWDLLKDKWTVSVNNKEVTNLQEFYEYIQSLFEKHITLIEALERQLKGKKSVVLDNGVSVQVSYVFSVIRDPLSYQKAGNELNSEETEIFKFAFKVFQNAGYVVRFKGKPVTTWEEFYNYLQATAKHQP